MARRVYGVKGVADDLNVRLLAGYEHSDTAIAQAVVAALKGNPLVPADRVHRGGQQWLADAARHVRAAIPENHAEGAVQNLPGVKGVANEIVVKPQVKYRRRSAQD